MFVIAVENLQKVAAQTIFDFPKINRGVARFAGKKPAQNATGNMEHIKNVAKAKQTQN